MKKRYGEKLPLKRIKSIMQTNREIGKIQKGTPQLIGWAIEAFIEEVTMSAFKKSVLNGDNKITPGHVKEAILSDTKTFGFLRGSLSGVPDMARKATSSSGNYQNQMQQSQQSLTSSAGKKKGTGAVGFTSMKEQPVARTNQDSEFSQDKMQDMPSSQSNTPIQSSPQGKPAAVKGVRRKAKTAEKKEKLASKK